MDKKIQMLDLKSQYLKIKHEIDAVIQSVIDSSSFINGKEVNDFENALASYLHCNHVISCANGTDALQIALMSLNLNPDDEIIVPAFTYAATAEAVALLHLKPVMVDVDSDTFNINTEQFEKAITSRTKAIIPVHLFGQSADMGEIMSIAKKYNIWVIEDNAQSLGADFIDSKGNKLKTGTIGHIGCNSFFPSKNLGCFGDGGAICTNDKSLAEKIRMIANHGQKIKYHHSIIGCNSRLDTIQAAVLNVKLKYLDRFIELRKQVASHYYSLLSECSNIELPFQAAYSNHSFNQFTLKVKNGKRDALRNHLNDFEIPTMIYYPIPLNQQVAFKALVSDDLQLKSSKELCESVLSIPIHTELTNEEIEYISGKIKQFE